MNKLSDFKVGDTIRILDTSNIRWFDHPTKQLIGKTYTLTVNDFKSQLSHLNQNKWGTNFTLNDFEIVRQCKINYLIL